MNRVFVTGDVHGDIDIKKFKAFKKNTSSLDRTDIVIVCGDMGCLWEPKFDRYIQHYWEAQPYTVVWIDGNHENFDELKEFPIEEKMGGKVQHIYENVWHLCRGETFNFYGKTFYAMGGASSHDKAIRKEGKNWWKEELPTRTEVNKYVYKLEENKVVDYIITHSVPDDFLPYISSYFEHDIVTNLLQVIYENVSYKHWYSGHYHLDRDLYDNVTLIYDKIIELK